MPLEVLYRHGALPITQRKTHAMCLELAFKGASRETMIDALAGMGGTDPVKAKRLVAGEVDRLIHHGVIEPSPNTKPALRVNPIFLKAASKFIDAELSLKSTKATKR